MRRWKVCVVGAMLGLAGCAPPSSVPPPPTPASADGSARIGATIERRDDGLTIVALVAEGPAEAAGLRVGDVLYEVGARNVIRASPVEAAAALRGPEGTTVLLRIGRQPAPNTSRDVLEITLVRGGRLGSATPAVAPRAPDAPSAASAQAAPTVVIDREGVSPLQLVGPSIPTRAPARCPGGYVVVATYHLDVRRPPYLTHFVGLGARGRTATVLRPRGTQSRFCNGTHDSFSLQPGQYDLDVLAPASPHTRGAEVGVLIVTKRGAEPLFRSPIAIPPDLTVEERWLDWHYPNLRLDRVASQQVLATPAGTLAQRYFLDAPRSLFVTVDRDLTPSDVHRGSAVALPRAGDALLVWSGAEGADRPTVLTAFGELLTLSPDRIVPATGHLVVTPLPASATDAKPAPKASEVEALTEEAREAREALTTCLQGAERQLEAQLEAARRSGARTGRRRLDAIWNQGIEQAERRCGLTRTEEIEARAKAAQASLAHAQRVERHGEIARRLADLP